MPIAGATAILQSLPLAVTLAAAVFFGEPVGWRRYLAIAIGFLGVLIIVRPGSDHFNAYALWALAAIGFIVSRDLSTRRMSPGTPGMAVVFVTTGVLTLAAGLCRRSLPTGQPVSFRHLAVLAVAAICLLVGVHGGLRRDAGRRDRLRPALPLHAARPGRCSSAS